jgi:hypothetical protein
MSDIRGMGDLIAKASKLSGVDKLADKLAKSLGYEDCGCEKRREELNIKIPFNPPKNK